MWASLRTGRHAQTPASNDTRKGRGARHARTVLAKFPTKNSLFCKSEAWWRKNDSAFSRRLMDSAIVCPFFLVLLGINVPSDDESIRCFHKDILHADGRMIFINFPQKTLQGDLFCFRFRHGLFAGTLLFLAGDR